MKITPIVVAAATINHTINNGTANINIKNPLQSGSLANIYVNYGSQALEGKLSLSFGNCQSGEPVYDIAQMNISQELHPEKFVWFVPEDAYTMTGCLLAKNASGNVFAKSESYNPSKNRKKRLFGELAHLHFDAVHYHHNDKSNKHNYAISKDAKIGIVGAGISGLFSALLLDQTGYHDYDILEANDKVGGRLRTVFFDNTTDNYQDMGAMRFPFSAEVDGKTFKFRDHDIVYQLADELNSINKDSHRIEFIDWWEERPNNLYFINGFRLPDGRIPTIGEVKANPNLIPKDPILEALSEEADNAEKEHFNADWFDLMSKDMYAAHEKAMEEGYDDWSEWSWFHNKMGVSLNATDQRISERISVIWNEMYKHYNHLASNWKSIKGGLFQLPSAFLPMLGDKIRFKTRVSKLEFIDDKVSVQWKEKAYGDYSAKKYDNVIVSVPFSIVNSWHLPKEMNYGIVSAIKHTEYSPACKVALEFSSRFWEKYERPIQGGCDHNDLMSESICYPANNLGTDGPGIVLASYTTNKGARPVTFLKEEIHVDRVLEDFTLLHGDLVKKYYTGKYKRVCWLLEPNQAGAWALDGPGQQTLFLPNYFKMEHGVVFVGEHTDIKHAWTSAALESAIRGVVMILIDNGHIDEAKDIIHKYNATWLNI